MCFVVCCVICHKEENYNVKFFVLEFGFVTCENIRSIKDLYSLNLHFLRL